MYCNYCGAFIVPDGSFCPACGRRAASVPAAAVRPAPPEPPAPAKTRKRRKRSDAEELRCPKCGGIMEFQTVEEEKRIGCFTFCLWLILCFACWWFFFMIPWLCESRIRLRNYTICQSCGYRRRA